MCCRLKFLNIWLDIEVKSCSYASFRYEYDFRGRMVAVQFTATSSNNVGTQKEMRYSYKSASSKYPEKLILPSHNEFKFQREVNNEELFGIVTPKHQSHRFQLIPLMGKTLFYYRPPWIKSNQRPYHFVFNDITTDLMGETLILPNGDSIFKSHESVVGCQNVTISRSMEKCYTITFNVSHERSEISSSYKTEQEGKVIFRLLSAYSH